MTLRVRKATEKDAEFVACNLWKRGAQEYQDFGFHSLVDVILRFREFTKETFSFVLVDETDEPIVFMGALAVAPGRYRTWFQATERFDEIGREATRLVRRFLREKMDEHPDAELELVTVSRHPHAHQWFRVVGFDPVGIEDAWRVYRYA